MVRTLITSTCLTLLSVSCLQAGVINIVVGNPVFTLKTGRQSFNVFVSSAGGDTPVQYLSFVMDIEGETTDVFYSPDIVSDSRLLFYSNKSGQVDLHADSLPRPTWFVASTTTTQKNSVIIGENETLLGIVYIDTDAPGLTAGTYALRMSDTEVGSTEFGLELPNITNGTITFRNEAVPEPGALLLMGGLMACGGPALGWYRRRRGTATWAGRRAKDGQGLAREG